MKYIHTSIILICLLTACAHDATWYRLEKTFRKEPETLTQAAKDLL